MHSLRKVWVGQEVSATGVKFTYVACMPDADRWNLPQRNAAPATHLGRLSLLEGCETLPGSLESLRT